MEKYYYKYDEFKDDVKSLAFKVKSFNPDVLLSVARGGVTLGHGLSLALDMRELYTLNSVHYDNTTKLDTVKISNIPDLSKVKKVLIVDDMVDSGETMKEIFKVLKENYPLVDFKLATIFYKNDALLQPDFKLKIAHEWIDFFWEVDFIEEEKNDI